MGVKVPETRRREGGERWRGEEVIGNNDESGKGVIDYHRPLEKEGEVDDVEGCIGHVVEELCGEYESVRVDYGRVVGAQGEDYGLKPEPDN